MGTYDKLRENGLVVEPQTIESLCSRYHIREFAFFGSAIRADFVKESDVDVLVSFDENADISLFDIIAIAQELEIIFQRPVDVVEKESLRNPIRKRNILETREVVYAA